MWASSRDGRKIRFFFHSAWHKWMSRPWVNWRSSVHIHPFMNPVVRRLVYMFILFPIHLSGTSDAPPMPGGCPVKTSAVKKVWRKKTSLLPHKRWKTIQNQGSGSPKNQPEIGRFPFHVAEFGKRAYFASFYKHVIALCALLNSYHNFCIVPLC